MIIPTQHSSLKYESLLKYSCRELFDNTPINFFNFARFYKKGYVMNFTTNNDWHKHYWKTGYIKNASGRLVEGINYWAGTTKMTKAAIDAEKNFDISARIEIIKAHENHIDSFSYASSIKDKELMIDFYLNNINQLENFNLFFISEFRNIIKVVEKKEDFLLLSFLPKLIKTDPMILNLHNKSKKILFTSSGKDIIFTSHQFKVISFKIRGYSNEDIAKILDCSIENIKTHIKNFRMKLKISAQEGYIEKCINMGIYGASKTIYNESLNTYHNV
jgi:DNA-binding CsgD family transcriptional regulator